MRKLKANERIIKEYDRYILIEVACPHGNSYRTTIDKWEQKDFKDNISKTQEEKIESQLDKLVYRR